jgi:hypothetical protein
VAATLILQSALDRLKLFDRAAPHPQAADDGAPDDLG